MRMNRLGGLLTALLVAHAAVAPAFAQDALVVDGQYLSASRDPGAPIGPAPPELQLPLAGGGRYAVGGAAVIDRVTGQRYPLPISAVVLAVDPVRPRVFLAQMCNQTANACDVVAWYILSDVSVHLTTMAYLSPFVPLRLSDPVVRYAVDADVLFVDRAASVVSFGRSPARSILPLNASTGVPLRPEFTTRPASWDVWPDGSRLVVGTS